MIPRNTRSLTIILPLVVLFLCISGWMLFRPSSEPIVSAEAPSFIEDARVEVANGTVTVLDTASGESQDITTSHPLTSGVTIQAHPGSEATLYWPDGSLTRLKGPGEIAVTEVLMNPNGVDTTIDYTVKQGEAWTKVVNMLSDDSSFTVRTESTVAGIRGTEVYHNVQGDREEIASFQHFIEISLLGSNTSLVLSEEEALTMKNGEQSNMGMMENGPIMPWLDEARTMDRLYQEGLLTKRQEQARAFLAEHPRTQHISLAEQLANPNLTEEERKTVLRTHIQELTLLSYAHPEQTDALFEELLTALRDAQKTFTPAERQALHTYLNRHEKLLFGLDLDAPILTQLGKQQRRKLIGLHLDLLPEENRRAKEAQMIGRELLFLHDHLETMSDEDIKEFFLRMKTLEAQRDFSIEDLPPYQVRLLQRLQERIGLSRPGLAEPFQEFQERYQTRTKIEEAIQEEAVERVEADAPIRTQPTTRTTTPTRTTTTTSTTTSATTTNTQTSTTDTTTFTGDPTPTRETTTPTEPKVNRFGSVEPM